MEHAAPWAITSENDIENIIYLCADSVRVCGLLLQPFMPLKMETLLDMLGVDAQSRSFKDARLGTNRSFGHSLADRGKQQNSLFPALPVSS